MTRVRASEVPHERPVGVNDDAVVTVFRVPPERAGQRLDLFLCGELHRASRTRTQAIVRISAYSPEGKRLRPNHRVFENEHIFLWRPPWDETPVPTELPVLYEDPHLLAIHKPAGIPVHPTARYHKNTVIKLLTAARPGEYLSLGHRIDRETSGVLLIAKSRECDRALKTSLERRDGIEKTYLAFTWGVPSRLELGTPYRLTAHMELDPESPTNVKMRIHERGLFSSTVFLLEEIRTLEDRTYARVHCTLETGRQHQIRLHLQTLSAPIVGDKLYGPDEKMFARAADGELTEEDATRLELPRHALHAHEMRLPHPITRTPLEIRAELPTDLEQFWKRLRSREEPCRDPLGQAPRE